MSNMTFGFSRQIITPRVPVSLAGYFTLRPWDGVLDDLLVQALAVQGAGETAVLLQFDLVTIPRDFTETLRRRCSDISGLESGHVILTASHTHTAPVVRAEGRGGNPEYNRFVLDQAEKAVRESVADLQPGSLEYGAARDDRFAFNRRYWMADGRVVTNPPRRDPSIVRPEGPIDPHIGLLRMQRNNHPTVLIASISNHADTITGTKVSADWPGFVRRSLEADDPRLRVITLTAPEGNVNHFNPHGDPVQSGYDVARRIGLGYAESIRNAFSSLQPSATDTLCARTQSITVGPREIPSEDIEQAREHAKKYAGAFRADGASQLTSEDLATQSPAALKYFADRLLELAEDRSDHEFEIGIIRLGDAVLVALPGEPFVEYGIRIREELRSGLPTLVAALSDGRATYIPTPDNIGRGGYETTPRCSPYTVQTGPILLDAVRNLLEDLA